MQHSSQGHCPESPFGITKQSATKHLASLSHPVPKTVKMILLLVWCSSHLITEQDIGNEEDYEFGISNQCIITDSPTSNPMK